MADMTYRQMGGFGVRVSPLAVGTANFGWLTDEATSEAILDHALDAGVNLVDTASNYNAGDSEEIVGRWLGKDKRRREQVILATKVYYPPNKYASRDPIERSGVLAGPNAWGLSARHIKHECEASLRRLGVDHIDLYQMHHIDRLAPFEEVWEAMEALVTQGKIVYVGSSNFAGWHIARACETAKARHFLGPVSEQSMYNLKARTVELEVLPACEGYGLGFLAFSPLAGGLLGGLGSDAKRRTWAASQLSTDDRQRIEQFEKLCADIGVAPSLVATAWLIAQPRVTSTILGPRTLEQFDSALDAVGIALSPETLDQLDKLFPGPGGPAPEAYAW